MLNIKISGAVDIVLQGNVGKDPAVAKAYQKTGANSNVGENVFDRVDSTESIKFAAPPAFIVDEGKVHRYDSKLGKYVPDLAASAA